MDVKLLQDFIVEMVPKPRQREVNDLFEHMRTNPLPFMSNSIVYTQHTYFMRHEQSEALAACVNGLLLGLVLAQGLDIEEGRKMMQGYIDAANKARGENVVNFLQKKGHSHG